MPFYPIPPILGCVLNLLLAVFISPLTWAVAVGWLLFGAVIYAGLNREQLRGFFSGEQRTDSYTERPGETDMTEPVEED